MIAFALLRFPDLGLHGDTIDESVVGAYAAPLVMGICGIGILVKSDKFVWACVVATGLMLLGAVWLFIEVFNVSGLATRSLLGGIVAVGVFSAGMLASLIVELVIRGPCRQDRAEQAAAPDGDKPPK